MLNQSFRRVTLSIAGLVMPRRQLMRAVVAFIAAAIVGLAAPAGAQDWPSKPITIVVPFGAGGSADLLARILATHMQAKFGQAVVVENRAGAGGSIGTNAVAKSAPDGYTLLLGTVSSIAVNAALYAKLPFDVDKDLQPVTQLVSFPNLLFVNPKLPVKDVPELVAYLKANEGKANYGSSGVGTSGHLSVVMFERATGVKMTHIPYKSTTDVVTSMLGGNIDLAIDSMTTIWPQAKQGLVRPLGVSTPKRVETAPDVPALGETVKGFEAVAWQGLFAPAGVPKPIVEKIAAEARRVWSLPEVRKALVDVGADSALSESPDAFVAFTRAERLKWAEVVKAAGVKIE
jgi:tripartite-type tricarboxylate transporter receptor subunit TctC